MKEKPHPYPNCGEGIKVGSNLIPKTGYWTYVIVRCEKCGGYYIKKSQKKV